MSIDKEAFLDGVGKNLEQLHTNLREYQNDSEQNTPLDAKMDLHDIKQDIKLMLPIARSIKRSTMKPNTISAILNDYLDYVVSDIHEAVYYKKQHEQKEFDDDMNSAIANIPMFINA